MKQDKTPLCDLYVARIPNTPPTGRLFPPEREQEVAQTRNERVRKEKYYVWRLLELALQQSLGITIKQAELYKSESGKWLSPHLHLSLSHTKDAVAVALSSEAVGVDIEQYHTPHPDRLAARVLTERELTEYHRSAQQEELLLQKWVAKEALFKASNESVFSPGRIETTDARVVTDTLVLGDTRYTLALATDLPQRLRVFKDVDLSKE